MMAGSVTTTDTVAFSISGFARATSATALENAAVLIEARPAMASGVADAVELREAIAVETDAHKLRALRAELATRNK